jgi:hypothetical protein
LYNVLDLIKIVQPRARAPTLLAHINRGLPLQLRINLSMILVKPLNITDIKDKLIKISQIYQASYVPVRNNYMNYQEPTRHYIPAETGQTQPAQYYFPPFQTVESQDRTQPNCYQEHSPNYRGNNRFNPNRGRYRGASYRGASYRGNFPNSDTEQCCFRCNSRGHFAKNCNLPDTRTYNSQ